MKNIVLIGYKGSGKSYFGALLAKELGMELFETDVLAEKRYQEVHNENLTCREISKKWGEGFFRSLEKEVIQSLKKIEGSVISTGGGAILSVENIEVLQRMGTCIYLAADKEMIKGRILRCGVPSFLDPTDIDGSFEKMYKERKFLYEDAAHMHIQLTGKSDLQVLQYILNTICVI